MYPSQAMTRWCVAFGLAVAAAITACRRPHGATAAGEVSSALAEAEVDDEALDREIAKSDVLRQARALIDSGHPWRATQIIAPVLHDPAKRTNAAVLLAGRAAAGWGGWDEVDKLLAGESWIDGQFDGEGRELRARAALERDADSAVLEQSSRALADAKTGSERAIRLVFVARALERTNQFDSAATMYAAAARELKPVHDWLALRAAGSENDSTARADAFGSVKLGVARGRIGWTEAQARERFADVLGASARYAALGAVVPALRLRLTAASSDGARDSVKTGLLAFVRAHGGTADARSAVDVLDKAFPSLAPAEELSVARSAAVSGPMSRAIAAFGHALAEPTLVTPADRIQYAQLLGRANRAHDAFAQLDAVTGPLAGQAAYQRARILLTSGTADATRAALKDVATRFPADSIAASSALYLLADLATDAADDAQARSLLQQLYQKYPSSARAVDARFRAALIALVGGDAKSAAVELDSLYTLAPRSDEATAARYWSGRAWAAAGDDASATARWRAIVDQPTVSYYTIASARRLNAPAWKPAPRADAFPHVASIDEAVARIKLLERLGMDVEAHFELDALDDQAFASPERTLATAHAFLVLDQPARAIRLGQKLIDSGQRDARAYRLAFPIPDRDEVARDARTNALEPSLVAGLIRQESSFNERAVSVAGARGLMQVLPSVGEQLAHALAFPVWYPVLLTDPDANLQMGTSHLATFAKQYGALPRVLAAYNAGGSRVTRWSTKIGVDDPEMFSERIPFVETRDYVRLVQRNAAIYAALYRWP